ncbi:hypothetical protein G9H61_10745 [Aquirufa ecclesiirivi]|uniref:Uncharacterized protein n=1 Tax=Aquirufa ecclesiirivi TaxID=2715124 RepID=A0ABT4JIX9_9BACT|nr:hypothetical protein [Aquirufa ecclesiirivi]MCZ2475928.1 hypothetical protein [Aquirufa ecclesiirivi]
MASSRINFVEEQIKALIDGNQKINIKEIAQLVQLSERTVKRKIEGLTGKKIKEINYTRVSNKTNGPIDFENSEIEDLVKNHLKTFTLDSSTYHKLIRILTYSKKLSSEGNTQNKKHSPKFKKWISTIKKVMESGKQIIIPMYNSYNSNKTVNRQVTPIYIDEYQEKLYALENGKKKCFNFNRIQGEVGPRNLPGEQNTSNWLPNEDKDVFGYSIMDNKLIHVELSMDRFAHSLLVHDFPIFETISKVTKNGREVLHFDVVKIDPIARFISGMLNRITILGSEEAIQLFKIHFNEKVLTSFNKQFPNETITIPSTHLDSQLM